MLGQVSPSHNRCLGKKKEFGLEGTHGRRPRMLETEVSRACLGEVRDLQTQLQPHHTWLEETRRGSLLEAWEEAGPV